MKCVELDGLLALIEGDLQFIEIHGLGSMHHQMRNECNLCVGVERLCQFTLC